MATKLGVFSGRTVCARSSEVKCNSDVAVAREKKTTLFLAELCACAQYLVFRRTRRTYVSPKIHPFLSRRTPLSVSYVKSCDIESDPHFLPPFGIWACRGWRKKPCFLSWFYIVCCPYVSLFPSFLSRKKVSDFIFLLLYERKSFSRICFLVHCFVISLYSSKLRDAGRVPLFSSTKYQVSSCKFFAFSI